MRSDIKTILPALLVCISFAITAPANRVAGVLKAERQSVLNNSERYGFDTGDVSSIVFLSDQYSNLEMQWRDEQKAEITWSVEVVARPDGVKVEDLSLPLKVVASKKSGIITVQVVADKGRFKEQAASKPGSDESFLLDTLTRAVLRVKIIAKLPTATNIDTNQFKGKIFFPGKTAGKKG